MFRFIIGEHLFSLVTSYPVPDSWSPPKWCCARTLLQSSDEMNPYRHHHPTRIRIWGAKQSYGSHDRPRRQTGVFGCFLVRTRFKHGTSRRPPSYGRCSFSRMAGLMEIPGEDHITNLFLISNEYQQILWIRIILLSGPQIGSEKDREKKRENERKNNGGG